MKSIKIGTVEAAPGQKVQGFIKVGELADGSPVNVPLIILRGNKEGPCLWVQGMIHGTEFHGCFAILKLISMLDPKEMRGTLIALPGLNTLAIRSFSRSPPDPSGYFHNVDLNLAFPGHNEGDFNEQVASVLFEQIKIHANYLIDLHSAGKLPWTLCYDDGSKYFEESLNIAKHFGVETIVSSDYKGDVSEGYPLAHCVRMPFAIATSQGIPSIIVEAGWGGEIKEEVVKLVSEGIVNVMKYLNIISGQVILKDRYTIIKQVVDVKAKHGGIYIPHKKEGKVSKGELLGTIKNLFDEKIAEIRAPTNGIILSQNNYPFTCSGKMLFHIGIEA